MLNRLFVLSVHNICVRKANLKCSGQAVQQNAAGKNNFVALSAAANFSKCATLGRKINQFMVR